MDAFLVPPPTDNDADADSAATKSTDSDATEPDENSDASDRDEDDDATKKAEHGAATERACGDSSAVTPDPLTKEKRTRTTAMSDEQANAATEHADYLEDDRDEALPPILTSTDAATTVVDATGKKQMFTKSLAHRDDWLHRGIMLRDMDYYHYSRYVERVEMPRSGSAESFQKQHDLYYLFDKHYPLAKTFVQVLLKHAKTLQNVGPQCKRSDINGGEDNAVYKTYFHSFVHCPGPNRARNL